MVDMNRMLERIMDNVRSEHGRTRRVRQKIRGEHEADRVVIVRGSTSQSAENGDTDDTDDNDDGQFSMDI